MMNYKIGCVMAWVIAALGHSGTATAGEAAHEFCPRPAPGAPVEEPKDLRSENGVLCLDLRPAEELSDGF